jgi:dephospho-CoA kinase
MKVRIERLEQRGLSAEDANSRIESQASDEDRRAVSQFIITNGGDMNELEVAVDELWVALQKLYLEKNS